MKRIEAWLRTIGTRLAAAWRWWRTFYRVLAIVRFSVLLGVIGGLVLVFNDQAQDVLHALGEDEGADAYWRIVWFVAAAVASACLAWWSARVMFYFRFDNPASGPEVFPWLKDHLPRLLGATALWLIAAATFTASRAYPSEGSGPGLRLVLLAGSFGVLGAVFWIGTAHRRKLFGLKESRPANLAGLRELTRPSWLPLVVAAIVAFGFMILFAYHSVAVAPRIGTGAVAMLAAFGLLPVGSFVVYLGNRWNLPTVTLGLLWLVFCTYWVDNHFVRVSSASNSHDVPPQLPPVEDVRDSSLRRYFDDWLAEARPSADGRIPVFIVATEGGGIRAAYWTALVLGEIEDRARASQHDFSGHVFAISGVSGGSLGGATFASLIANRDAGMEPRTGADCGIDDGSTLGLRARAERVLQRDFLSPTVSVMLFSDFFQQFLPIGVLDDRAHAIEQAWEAAWDACEPGERLTQPLTALWPDGRSAGVPLLFLNSTVVETGQRLIASPVRIDEPTFSEALDGLRAIGPDLPLSTAVHTSARFTYVSPAGTVRRRDGIVQQNGTRKSQWIRLVDGGYFENSGAVTAAEILRVIQGRSASRPSGEPPIRLVVLHLSNDPATTDPNDLLEERKVLNQPLAPIKALLNTRQARGFQAREDLAQRAGTHLHFRLCSNVEGSGTAKRQPLPLGWALSSLARVEMHRQLGLLPADAEERSIAIRNRRNMDAVLAALAGSPVSAFGDENVWDCP